MWGRLFQSHPHTSEFRESGRSLPTMPLLPLSPVVVSNLPPPHSQIFPGWLFEKVVSLSLCAVPLFLLIFFFLIFVLLGSAAR